MKRVEKKGSPIPSKQLISTQLLRTQIRLCCTTVATWHIGPPADTSTGLTSSCSCLIPSPRSTRKGRGRASFARKAAPQAFSESCYHHPPTAAQRPCDAAGSTLTTFRWSPALPPVGMGMPLAQSAVGKRRAGSSRLPQEKSTQESSRSGRYPLPKPPQRPPLSGEPLVQRAMEKRGCGAASSVLTISTCASTQAMTMTKMVVHSRSHWPKSPQDLPPSAELSAQAA